MRGEPPEATHSFLLTQTCPEERKLQSVSLVGPKVIAVQIKVRDPPCGRALLSPGVIMNCDRTPGEEEEREV